MYICCSIGDNSSASISLHHRRTGAPMSKTFAVVLLFLATSTLYAATPTAATLSSASATVTWSGGPYTGNTVDTSPVNTSLCTTLTCDSFNLSANIPANFYTTNLNDEVQVTINWASD